jgi:hypothetical protein
VNWKIFRQILSGHKLLICYEISTGAKKLRSLKKKYVKVNGFKDADESNVSDAEHI